MPADLVGKHVIAVAACYAGPIEDGAQALRPLKSFGQPLLDLCGPKPYLVHQSMFDAGFPHGWWYYVRSCDVAELNDDVIDIMAEHGRPPPVQVAVERHGELDQAANLAAAFAGKRGRQQR